MQKLTIVDKFSQDALEHICQDSFSLTEVMSKLGYSTNSGSSRNVVINRIQQYGIDISHFTNDHKNYIKRTPENVFIKNSTATQNIVRKLYTKGQYTPYQCAICGQEPFWNGKSLTLTLDHIDGDNTNNELKNLRWICPNCNRQSPTFCSKNRRESIKLRYCIDCGVKITRGHIRCQSCELKTRKGKPRPFAEKIDWPNDTELQNMVNIYSLVSLGKALGVSDGAIRKRCKVRGITIPTTKKQTYMPR